MFKRISIIITLEASAATVFAEDAQVAFSSAYTQLSKECKCAYSESELSEGQDNALLCKGFGKYQIFIYFSASSAEFVGEM